MKKFTKLISLLLVLCTILCNSGTAILISSEGAPLSQSEQIDTTEARSYTIKDVLAGEATWADLYDGIDSETVPDAVGLDTALTRMHTQRLYKEEQSLNEVRFRNIDGTTTIYLFDYPVKYTNERGAVNDISLEIKDTDTTNIPYSTAAGNAVTTFSRNITDGINLSDNDVSVTLFPIIPKMTASATAKIGDDTSSSSLVKRIDNKTVAYNYDSQTTIEYSLTYTGFKEDIVVAEYTGQTEYDFTLETNGLFLIEQKGSFNLCDSDGNIKAALGDIIIFTADEKNNAFGNMTARTIVEGERYLLTIHVDEDYLSDPNTTYPIRIDPTIEINYESSGSAALEDVTINTIDTLSGSATTLGIGKYGDDQSVSRVLMRFPGLDLSTISSATLIQSASVEIRDLMCQHEQLAVYCHAFTGNVWSESNANWNNVSPNSYGDASSMHYISYADGVEQATSHRYAFDITDIVIGWKLNASAQSKGIIFKASTEDEADPTHNYKTFASYNRSTNKPSFTLTYSGEDPYEGVLSDNTYYLNNLYTGKYLYKSGYSSLGTASGLINELEDTIRWQIINTNNGYYVRSAENTSKYLGVSNDRTTVVFYTVNDLVIPEECVWTIGTGRSGGCLISYTNDSSGPLYLKASQSGSLQLTSSLGAIDSESYKSCSWRVADIEFLGTEKQELSSQSYFNDYSITLPNSKSFSLKKYYSNEIWTSNSDFTFARHGTGGITISGSYINTYREGNVAVTAIHKVTGRVLSFDVTVNPLLIYRTRNRETLGFADADSTEIIIAEDYTYGEKSTNTLLTNGTKISLTDLYSTPSENIQLTIDRRVEIIKNYFHSALNYDQTFVTILDEMIDHFVEGNGNEFSNDALTNAVENHPRTLAYINAVKDLICNYLENNNANISTLFYDENLWTQPEARALQPMVAMMLSNMESNPDLYEPSYPLGNGILGLTFCLDSLYGNKFEITSFSSDGQSYSGTIRFTFYDHFGLDTPDLVELKADIAPTGLFPAFRQWYILQHWSELDASVQPKPFVTTIVIEDNFSGSIG